ncbi:MAG: recF [Chloroflexi bacterium]|nr:recF [Chloroflexota bacterium]
MVAWVDYSRAVEFAVHLRSLKLTNYRNFRRLALSLDDGPTVVQAENAQGKTNLLEAIALLATTKSGRASSDRELIHWAALQNNDLPAEPFARISAVIGHERGEIHADVVVRAGDPTDDGTLNASKTFRLNGLPRRAVEFIGEINVVSFSPEDVELVAGAPSGRRRYLDVTNSQMSSRYLRTLQRFNRVLQHRNHLLRTMREQGRHDPSLEVWNQELATNGAFLFQERARSLQALNELADRWFRELGSWGQHLEIRYAPAIGDSPKAAILQELTGQNDEQLGRIHSMLLEALERSADRERAAGMSLIGPHRDDFSFRVDGIDLNTYGSRGQQRLAALSLKLAELDLLGDVMRSRPILLLDDVLSELDARKQAAVLRVAATAGQAIITLTSLDVLKGNALPGARVLTLETGALVDRELRVAP